MYIQRIAIDANRINARGSIPEMTALERYHDAQVIEIVQTSTLTAEFQTAPLMQRQKAAKYRTIGSSGIFWARGEGRLPDATTGATGTDSRWWEILRIVFPLRAENPGLQDRRDALHIDQAMQNAVDWFVTNERAIINAQPSLLTAGIDLRIGDAPEVLTAIEEYFQSRYGTLDVAVLRKELMRDFHSHPVIVGSNRVGIWELAEPTTGETAFFTRIIDNKLGIGAVLRDCRGERLVTINPGATPKFERAGPSLVLMVGESHLFVGEKPCTSFAVSFEGKTILEGRVARSGHIVISRGLFRSTTGAIFATIHRESLTLGNCIEKFSNGEPLLRLV